MARRQTSTRAIAGAWKPMDIPGMSLRVRAALANGGGLDDGTAVDYLIDEIGGNHARASGTARPTYKRNIANGKPAIRFDGTDDQIAGVMQMPGNITLMYAVVNYTGALPFSGTRTIIGRNSASPADCSISGTNATSTLVNYGNVWVDGVATTTITAGNHIILVEDTSPGNVWASGYMLGRYGTAGSFSSMDLMECGVYTSTVSAENRALLESYLSEEYGVTI